MSRPLPIAFILLISGIIFAHHIFMPFFLIIGLIAFLFILTLIFGRKKTRAFYLLCSLLIFTLGICAYLNFNSLGPSHISRLIKEGPKNYYIEGVVTSSPEYYWRNPRKRQATFLIKARSYKKGDSWIGSSGISKVEIKESEAEYSYGDLIVFLGRLKAPEHPKDPRRFDYAAYLKNQGIYTIASIGSDDDIVIIEKCRPFLPKRFIFNARAGIERLIKRYLPARDGLILNAMLIGKRSALPTELKDLFIKTGTAHILSISGLHVGVLSAIIFFILRFIGVGRKVSCILIIGFLILYAILAGARTPIIRAVIMITVYLLAYLLEREFDIYSALSLAGIIILMVNPMQAFSAGFILSFASVFFICYLTPILEYPFRASERSKPARYILRVVLASFAVYIGIMPLIAYYFDIISPVTILANLIIVPLLGALLFIAILFIIFGGILAPAALFFGFCLHIMFTFLLKVITYLSDIPFSYFYVSDIPAYAVTGYYALFFMVIFMVSRRIKSRNKVTLPPQHLAI